jgi:deoxyadenosine/deoxycytidine kinase
MIKKLISIEGNIGSGKSSFMKMMEESAHIYCSKKIKFIEEPVKDWEDVKDPNDIDNSKDKVNLLELFYKEPNKYGYLF